MAAGDKSLPVMDQRGVKYALVILGTMPHNLPVVFKSSDFWNLVIEISMEKRAGWQPADGTVNHLYQDTKKIWLSLILIIRLSILSTMANESRMLNHNKSSNQWKMKRMR